MQEHNYRQEPVEARSGLLAMGNFIVDYVKIIDHWPEQDTLASILSESRSNGGGPFNLLMDLRALGADFPLEACGLVGDDANGAWIVKTCKDAGIDTRQLHISQDSATSYTEAMTVKSSGRRTFFHQRGANALLTEQQLDLRYTRAKLFYLAYIMLLDNLDVLDEEHETGVSRILQRAKASGLVTAVDCVSSAHPDFSNVAVAALRHSDMFFANEFEAGQILQRRLEPTKAAMQDAALALLALGCPGTVLVHSHLGACLASASGKVLSQAAIALPEAAIQGATGAGDAFVAAYLYGIHQGQSEEASLLLAVCCAAASLRDPRPSAAILAAEDCIKLADSFGCKPF